MPPTITISTAQDMDAMALDERRESARLECRRRILAVADETAQIIIAAASCAGLLPPADATTYATGLGWGAAMRATWPVLADNAADIIDDAIWPAIPAGVAELAAQF